MGTSIRPHTFSNKIADIYRMKKSICFLPLLLLFFVVQAQDTKKNERFNIIAYYAGDAASVDNYPMEKLTHIIYSFCHLKGNKLNIDNAGDTATILKLTGLKKRLPELKVLLSLGGWSGCKTCSPVFSKQENRKEFAASVKKLCEDFNADGIDLDWEYPAIPGPPGHPYKPEDRENFTALIKTLRNTLGIKYEISFAAGGFTTFLQESVEWNKVMPLIDRVNLMTYDLVHGYSTVTGHQTPLYSTPEQTESADHAVKYLDSIGVPKNKMVIGAAFYARIFKVDTNFNNGLYQTGKFYKGVSYKGFDRAQLEQEGYTYYWDRVAKAPFMYNPNTLLFYTYDDEKSLREKTKYALENGLNGIMFWQLTDDNDNHDLLNAIYKTVEK